jgi:uncharacterized protein YbaP (TraB family)
MLTLLRRRLAHGLALVFGLALAAQIIACPARAIAEPAIWKVQGPHATVWLFGSIHALKPDLKWRSAKMDAALKSSDALWLEIDNADDPAAMQPLIIKYGLDVAHPLSTKLSADDKAALDRILQTYGASEAQVEPMRPWMAALMIDVLPIVKAGYDPSSSVEHALTADIRAAGKPVHGLETAEQQVRLFADLPQDQEIAYLKSSMDDAAKGVAELDQLVTAWQAGDVDAVARLINEDIEKESPSLYKLVIVDRNARFAQQIADLAKGDGVVFVAVGAGHLAGPDSIQADLAHLGLTAVRQ